MKLTINKPVLFSGIKDIASDIVALIGFVSIVYGLYLIYHPVAFIIGGLALLTYVLPAKPKKGI